MTTLNERAVAFRMLEQADPGNHLLDCPNAVVVRGAPVPDQLVDDGTWVTAVWAVQCGHGHTCSKLTLHVLVTDARPEENRHG